MVRKLVELGCDPVSGRVREALAAAMGEVRPSDAEEFQRRLAKLRSLYPEVASRVEAMHPALETERIAVSRPGLFGRRVAARPIAPATSVGL